MLLVPLVVLLLLDLPIPAVQSLEGRRDLRMGLLKEAHLEGVAEDLLEALHLRPLDREDGVLADLGLGVQELPSQRPVHREREAKAACGGRRAVTRATARNL